MKTLHVCSAALLWFVLAPSLGAQPPFGFGGRGGFGDRDDDERGGFRGRGGFDRGRGGFGRRDDDDDDRGSSRGRGGFRGRGGPGGPGGFDPSGFLRRLDRNGNGTLDPDEQEGPAAFLIRRLQQSNPSIEAGEPIPLERITESFQRLRRDRGGRDEDDDDDDDDDRRRRDEAPLQPRLLVPGFGVELVPMPLLGFGPAAEMLSVPVSEQDEQEAAERVRRYDRDRDGLLSQDELQRSRFSGDPLDFDRNRDGRLAASELAIRYAQRRVARQAQRDRDDDRRDDDRRDASRRWSDEQGDSDSQIRDPYGGRNSYRPLAASESPAGLPGWFAERDRDRDGQVAMAEYAHQWHEALVSEFYRFDLNRDGWITARECLRAVADGASASAMAPRGDSQARSNGSPQASGAGREGPREAAPAGVTPKLLAWAEQTIARYDTDGDGALVASEWASMLISPAAADADRDGRVTAGEYAMFRRR